MVCLQLIKSHMESLAADIHYADDKIIEVYSTERLVTIALVFHYAISQQLWFVHHISCHGERGVSWAHHNYSLRSSFVL